MTILVDYSEYSDGHAACHFRVNKKHGPARNKTCVDCGKPANDWSHIHNTEVRDPDNYEPRCRSCHRKYDFTDQWRANISKSLKGKNRSNYGRIGTNHPKAKLSEGDVLEIRRMYHEMHFLQREIAVFFDIKQVTVSRIVRRETWKHI